MSIQAKVNQRESLQKLDEDNIPEILYTKVLALLSRKSKLTAREIAKEIGLNTRQDIQPRLTELLGKGLIVESGKKFDEITKRTVTTYSLIELKFKEISWNKLKTKERKVYGNKRRS